MRRIFITGTDTNIGKTYVSTKLLQQFNQAGLKTIGIKPVATGATNGYNEDAMLLQQYSSVKVDYSLINPFLSEIPVSPNIAFSDLDSNKIFKALKSTLALEVDICLIEGVGGFMTPINYKETMVDFVKKFKEIEIILVVGVRLGCLNHSILTYQSIKAHKLNIKGWIANIIDPSMEEIDANIATLKTYIREPCLEIFQYEYYR